jgi:hypothetical protein
MPPAATTLQNGERPMATPNPLIRFHYEDYQSLPESMSARYELLDGDLLMVPAPTVMIVFNTFKVLRLGLPQTTGYLKLSKSTPYSPTRQPNSVADDSRAGISPASPERVGAKRA